MEKEEATSASRVRINLKQAASGGVQFDISTEFPTADESIAAMGDAIDKVKALCVEKNMKLAGE